MQLGISKSVSKKQKESALIMRKQTKIAAVVSAAALLALGASITSFAAVKGTWMMVDGEWYCYDKNGDAYTDTFCSSNGKEYYVGDDGQLVRSEWVEDGTDKYFVNSSGAKITNDWRLTTPYDDDSADEEWYYFQSTGKMAANKKITYKGKTYYFDSDGQMLTGWVTYDGTSTDNVDEANDFNKDETFYCDETGARVEKAWVYSTAPGIDDDDADADEYWYYFKSSGKAQTGKGTNINGQTYLFNNKGQMLDGWVAYTDSDEEGKKGYIEIGGEDSTAVVSTYEDVYFCGDEDDGHAKKNKWLKTWRPADYDDADEDNDEYWYWIDKNGKIYIPSNSDASKIAEGTKYKLTDATLEKKADYESITKKKVNSKDYFFNENGEMLCQFIEITKKSDDLQEGMYYFGGDNDGAMKTGSQSVKDDNGDTYRFFFGTKSSSGYDKKGVGITGNKSNKLYFKGLLITADDYKYQVADVLGHEFIVNKNGSIQTSTVEYKEDSDILVDASTLVKTDFEKDDAQWKGSIISGTYTNKVDEINIYDVMPK